MFIVGDMLGGGIYTLVGEVGARSRRRDLDGLPRRFRTRGADRLRLRRARHEVPARGRRRALHEPAFGVQFLTFMVAFAVMASGITSASTLARGFAGDSLAAFVDWPVIPVGDRLPAR